MKKFIVWFLVWCVVLIVVGKELQTADVVTPDKCADQTQILHNNTAAHFPG